jgi:hypothetical protein
MHFSQQDSTTFPGCYLEFQIPFDIFDGVLVIANFSATLHQWQFASGLLMLDKMMEVF